MREYSIDATKIKNPIYKAPIDMGGFDKNGKKLEIGNYYLKYDGKPFFAICGEAVSYTHLTLPTKRIV